MATRNYVEELDYMDAKGLDTTSPINLVSSGYVREALNIDLGSTGGYSKRQGYANAFSTPTAVVSLFGSEKAAIRQGVEYKKAGTPAEILLYASDDLTEAKFGKADGVTFTALKRWDILAESDEILETSPFHRPSLVQFGDGLYYFDGSGGIGNSVTPFVYEGNSTYVRQLGIEPPKDETNADLAYKPAVEKVTVGEEEDLTGRLTNGQYIYAFTYAFYRLSTEGDYRLIAESSPSDLSDTITVVDNQKVQLTLLPFSDYTNPSYGHFDVVMRIWRTVSNGNILFLEDSIEANLSTYISIKSDDELETEQMPTDNTRLALYPDYQKAKYPLVARNRLMVFHPNENRGRFSKIGLKGPLTESFPVQNEFSIEGKYGSADSLVGAGQIKGTPIILKERSIGRLDEIGIPDLGNSIDNVSYIYRELSDTVGAVSHFAQCQVFDELVFLGRDNIYATDGQSIRPIAGAIQNTIKNLDFRPSKTINISSINDTKNKRIYFQVFDATSGDAPNLTIVGDYQQYPNFRWVFYDKGPDSELYPGIKAGCFFQTEAIATGGLDIYFGSATHEGMYYKMNSGETDRFWDTGAALLFDSWVSQTQYNALATVKHNGQLYKALQSNFNIEPGSNPLIWTITPPEYPIYMRLVTRPYMFSQPLIAKLYKSAKIWIEARDPSYDFQFGAKFNLDATTINETSYTVPSVGSVWGIPPTGQLPFVWNFTQSEVDKYEELTGEPVETPVNDNYFFWSGPALKEYTYNLHKKARMMQLVFIQDDKNAPLSLLGWGVSGSIFSGI